MGTDLNILHVKYNHTGINLTYFIIPTLRLSMWIEKKIITGM